MSEPAGAPSGATERPDRTKGRVLVVDDDASLAEMLTIVLRQEGFDEPDGAPAATRRWRRSATTGPTSCCST